MGISISYAITACNEHIELKRLLDQLDQYIHDEDEIILQLDTTSTPEVKQVANDFNTEHRYGYKQITFPLNNDFASFKNNLIDFCVKDYCMFLDADEFMNPWLAEHISGIIEVNPDIDMFFVSRINLVEGLTPEHVIKWGWSVNDKGYVNYPDPQSRIFRNHKNIKWSGIVHETIQGFNSYTYLPAVEELCLIHPKNIRRQEQQNEFYNTL